MSKGTRIIGVRVPAELERDMMTAIARREQSSTSEPFTLTSFILAAIREKIAHMDRSRKPGRSKAKRSPADVPAD